MLRLTPSLPVSRLPLSVCLALTLAAAASHPAAAQVGRNQTTFTWSKSLAGGTLVSVRNGNGQITVREAPAGSDRVEVRATKIPRGGSSIEDVAFSVEESSDRVRICTLYGSQRSCDDRQRARNIRVRVEYTVLIPPTMRLSVATGNGDVSVERAGAEVSASTGNGDVTIGQTRGRVKVSTGNGSVRVAGANGPVSVSTGNGRVDVATSHGAVDATTGNGSIDVRIDSLPIESDMRFTSGSGSIRVTLPAAYNGRIDATTGSGNLNSDFEISIIGRLNAHHVRGTIGKGGALIRLSTGSGNISLRKG